MGKYRGKKTKEIIFPLGGMGTGSIGFSGRGELKEFEIFGRPDKGSYNGLSFFAIRAEDGDKILDARVLNGDLQKDRMGTFQHKEYTGFGYGADRETMAGFPHFGESTFTGEFPIAELSLADKHFPAVIRETAFNPFIPGDAKDSSLPVAMFALSVENRAEKTLTYTIALSLANPYGASLNTPVSEGGMRGAVLSSADKPERKRDAPGITLLTDAEDSFVQSSWYRGGWMDGIATFWKQFSGDREIPQRQYDTPGCHENATVFARLTLAPGQRGKARFVIAWYNPVSEKYWNLREGEKVYYRNYYATLFRDSVQAARYAMRHFSSLYRRSNAFRKALFGMSADSAVIDAAASTLSVLKSPTVLRLEDGSLWGWEGVHEKSGSCEGTCTHVWSYAYALCYLFPEIERGMRETEYKINMNGQGAVRFRTPLPPVPVAAEDTSIKPCLDGQMCGVIKTYREWKLSGDTDWMRSLYPLMKKSLTFALHPDSAWRWDADGDGVLEGMQHHTLDMELFGPSGWLEGLYIAALTAGAEMADAVGDKDAALFRSLAAKGKAYTEKNLFRHGRYIQNTDLKDRTVLAPFGEVAEYYWNEEAGEMKYQIGEGSALDQMLGQWHAHLCGLGDIFDPANRKTALANLYRNNFHPSMREVVNPWRVFTLQDEAGASICTFPDGAQAPVIPIPYAEECMHGFEYAFAGLLLAEGFEKEGLSVVKGVRDKYDGEKRNPFNEMECGSHYARSMAAFALLPILAGYTCDMTEGRIGFRPLQKEGEFRGVFGAAGAFGRVTVSEGGLSLSLTEGKLSLASLDMPDEKKVNKLTLDGKAVAFRQEGRRLYFEKTAFVRLTAETKEG